ncbi:MAG: GSU2403 family nucleotidyltransferase fold protein [Candidatus Omnitrophota bacterium]|nr:GSU2403 family nucleotidyltransferase fold protein [Candidatus Omnitrophota bacterium]
MESSQYKLCVEVLKRLDSSGILKHLVLVGSWCVPFYKEYFSDVEYVTSITTRDLDLFVPLPLVIKNKIDIEKLLDGLGFVIDFKGSDGYIQLYHPELILEFLVTEKGAGLNKPYKLGQLGINAQPLRLLNLLTAKLINIVVEDIRINLPHPALFALHKLIVSERRPKKDKKIKDLDMAIRIIRALLDKGEADKLKFFFIGFSPKLRKRIIDVLKDSDQSDLADVLI